MLKKIGGVLVGVAPMSAFAVPPTTVAELTTGISFADVGLAVLAVTAVLLGYYLIKKGAKEVTHTVKSM